MTSSFRQPRDPYALGATNYLATAPDLTDAMIKEQDANIKDTQEFYQQMAELEKQRFEQRDKNLANLTSLIKDSVTIVQRVRQANDDRNEAAQYVEDYEAERGRADDENQEGIETEEKKYRADEKVLGAAAEKDSTDPTLTQEQRDDAGDASSALVGLSFSILLSKTPKLLSIIIPFRIVLYSIPALLRLFLTFRLSW